MDVHYRDEDQGFALVLIHELSSSVNTWDGWEEQLQGDFQIISLYLSGFGQTGPYPNYEYSIEIISPYENLFKRIGN